MKKILIFTATYNEVNNVEKLIIKIKDNCDEANDCIFLTMSSYIFGDGETTYGDGDWTFKIQNDKQNDLQVESFIIRLVYV